jgi:four helix bundle protein
MRRYEDIQAWQKARSLTSEIYKTTKQGSFSRDFGLRDQVRRAAVSVMANVAEGFGRKTNKDFANFLQVARASAMEVTSHLYVALDQNYISKEVFDELYDGYDHVGKMLTKLIHHLKKS